MSEFTSCGDCVYFEDAKVNNRWMCGDCIHNGREDLFKPKPKKIIDLSVCIESGIDMEFKGSTFWYLGTLTSIQNNNYLNEHAGSYSVCRIRESHWHSWQGGECPLPDGLKIIVKYFADYSYKTKTLVTGEKNLWNNIFAFKVLGVADGWRYEWDER